MKDIFTIISLIFWSLFTAQAQIIPNGSFEYWDTTDTIVPYPYPLMWKWDTSNIECPISGSQTMELSLLSSSGCCSVKLTAASCRRGMVYSGDRNAEFPPRSWAFECMARPALLDFQYMFLPLGSDSAYVQIMLFNYDSITPGLSYTQRMDTAGFASAYIHEEATSFTPFSLPIHYFTEDTPAFMQILFGTSKTQSGATEGTTLWVDDVHLSGTTDISEHVQHEPITIFPNPAGDRIWFKGPEITGEVNVVVFDSKGAQVLDQRITDLDRGLDVRGLHPGMYSIVMQTHDGRSLRTNWVKE